MPSVRFSRDKRGYEHVYLVDTSNKHGQQSRVLYWFRTPPGIRVGRKPFDEETQRVLESRNPGLVFDWKKIVSTSPPPPDIEHWRERRKSERAAKQSRAADEDVEIAEIAEIAVHEETATAEEPVAERAPAPEPASDPPAPAARRRRRRGGRHRGRPGQPAPAGAPPETSVETAAKTATETAAETVRPSVPQTAPVASDEKE